ncbi:hypothetical protein [Microbacterium sp. bgisy207]|uniref:hypothetical protein n=1 Tax=Microbacterium sp. bgisy207 TaxID=3413800 RepID=UPI003EB95D14
MLFENSGSEQRVGGVGATSKRGGPRRDWRLIALVVGVVLATAGAAVSAESIRAHYPRTATQPRHSIAVTPRRRHHDCHGGRE